MITTGTPGNWMLKSKLSPRGGSVALRQLNPIHKRSHKICLFKKKKKKERNSDMNRVNSLNAKVDMI